MKKLAIISSYNENCGNASYTHVLANALRKHVEVEIIPLDLFVLQKTGGQFKKLGDAHIEEIVRKLADFDYVNIQFEAGLYGAAVGDIRRRVLRLIEASKNLIFTMHRIDPLERSTWEIIATGVRNRDYTTARRRFGQMSHQKLYKTLIKFCESQKKTKNVWICVHTKRERRVVRDYYGVANVFDHPLAYLTPDERAQAWAHDDRAAFKEKYKLPQDHKIIGLFGYISAYKGIETAIDALAELPENYTLALFGSQHPQTIAEWTPIDSYLKQVVQRPHEIAQEHAKRKLARIKTISRAARNLDAHTIKEILDFSIAERVKFMGNLQDPEFIEALRLCDIVVLPYVEVGQSMSGVLCLAIESGAHMLCANNHSFFEARRYYGDVFDNFDIGNHVELAQRIENGASDHKEQRDKAYARYNIGTLTGLMMSHFEQGR